MALSLVSFEESSDLDMCVSKDMPLVEDAEEKRDLGSYWTIRLTARTVLVGPFLLENLMPFTGALQRLHTFMHHRGINFLDLHQAHRHHVSPDAQNDDEVDEFTKSVETTGTHGQVENENKWWKTMT